MKIAPILRELESRDPPIKTLLVHTGQHYDAIMSDVFFDQLGIRKPDAHLAVGSGSHGSQTGRLLIAFEEYVTTMSSPPRAVVVVGDVNSTMACALVAVKLGIGCAHVEAGLRSNDRRMPEEINRLVTDSIADLLLVSEPDGLRNLQREGVPDAKVKYVGNVMIDTLVHQLEAAKALDMPASIGVSSGNFGLVTLHRPSNVDGRERLASLVEFLTEVAASCPLVFPVHPRTASKLEAFGLRGRLESAPGMHLREPLGYRENLSLMAAAKLVISDSGGIQEETTFLGVPCVTLRPSTERPCTETIGTNTVVGEDNERARAAIRSILDQSYKSGGTVRGWDGHAATRVVDELIAAFPR